MSNKISIIMYHYVRNIEQSRYPNIKGLDINLFQKQIKFLSKNYNFVSSDELIEAFNNNTELPKNPVFLTFDDGYIDHYTNVFPILSDKEIPAFFSIPGKICAENKVLDVNKIHFILASKNVKNLLTEVFSQLDKYRNDGWKIPTNKTLYEKLAKANRFDTAETVFIKRLLQVELDEKLRNMIVNNLFNSIVSIDESAFAHELYMNYNQIKHMAKTDGISFGIHGYDHYWMNKLSKEDLEKDIDKALDVFHGIINNRKWICCYPYGSYDNNVISLCQKKGAVLGLGTDVNIASISDEMRFKLPRLDTNDFPPKSETYKLYL